MRVFTLIAMLVIASAGCSSKSKQAPQDVSNASDGREESPPNGSKSMSAGFSKATSKFREHAAQVLDVPPEAVKILPVDEEVANLPHMGRIGTLWQLEGNVDDRAMRGWANPEGLVVTYKQNLGALFEAADIWSEKPKLDVDELVKRLVWSMGMEYMLFVEPSSGAPVPALQVGEDGAGTLVFFVSYKQAGPGGAGGGPEQHYKATVTLTPDHKATLEMTEFAL